MVRGWAAMSKDNSILLEKEVWISTDVSNLYDLIILLMRKLRPREVG